MADEKSRWTSWAALGGIALAGITAVLSRKFMTEERVRKLIHDTMQAELVKALGKKRPGKWFDPYRKKVEQALAERLMQLIVAERQTSREEGIAEGERATLEWFVQLLTFEANLAAQRALANEIEREEWSKVSREYRHLADVVDMLRKPKRSGFRTGPLYEAAEQRVTEELARETDLDKAVSAILDSEKTE